MTESSSPFAQLGVPPALVAAIARQNATEPTPIQTAAIPPLLEGKHAVLNAETGTGKTLAYLLPLFARLDLTAAATQVIILAPTHELALQIHRQCTDLAQFSKMAVKSLLLIGGTSVERQVDKLKNNPHVVVGSPGRVRDLISTRKLKPAGVRAVVFDEADRLLVGETLVVIRAILAACPKGPQLVFASATEQAEASAIIAELSPGAEVLRPGTAAVNENIAHVYLVCEQRDKLKFLRQMLNALEPPRALVFANDNQLAERATADLDYHQVPVTELHPDFGKLDRKQAMDDFRAGRALVMVASDMAARGLDFPAVTHVFNLDAPMQPRAYLHRAGRTGRAGNKGTAITLLTEDELRLVKRYEKDLGIELHRVRMREGRLVPVGGPSAD
ncbi:MAG: DEAD/DEAH box helicase [Candidatus Eisenbacteria bacterium]|nr:DEAD/DEAH box helicase [Candidatus Eisenbacteria bacterium]